MTNLTLKERVNEVVLENMLSETHEEIPYIADIKTKSIRSLTERRIRIDVNIYVDTGAQQRIVIGHQARTLLAIRQKSVRTLEKIFGQQVILMLWVKTRMKNNKVNKNFDSAWMRMTIWTRMMTKRISTLLDELGN